MHTTPRRSRLALLAAGCLASAAMTLGAPSLSAANSTIVNPDGSDSVPWQVHLEADIGGGMADVCGGTVRDATHVITAAHCALDDSGAEFAPAKFTVEAGVVDVAHPESTMQARGVSAVSIFPGYDAATLAGDAAVLTLDQPLDLSDPTVVDFLTPVAAGETATHGQISGWGTTTENGTTSDTLAFALVDVFDNSACASYGSRFVAQTMLCAGRDLGNGAMVDSCQGDSGGPLARIDDTGHVDALVGIVSWGDGCARPGFPGIYTRVADPAINAFLTA
jgi:secreted trypsin-like serine protease